MTKRIQLEESKQIDNLLWNKVVSKLVLFGVSANEKRPRRQEEAIEGNGAVVRNNSKGEIWFAKKNSNNRKRDKIFDVLLFQPVPLG